MTLDTTITPGQGGHITDHDELHTQINMLEAAFAAAGNLAVATSAGVIDDLAPGSLGQTLVADPGIAGKTRWTKGVFIDAVARGLDPTFTVNIIPQLQAYQDLIEAAGGGTLYASAGDFKFGTGGAEADSFKILYLGDNVTLLGDGPGATTFRNANYGSTASTGMIRTKGRPVAGGGTGTRNRNITLRGFTVDGNKGPVTEFFANRQGLDIESVDNIVVDNVHVVGCITDGMVLAGCKGGSVTGCRAEGNLKAGFYAPGSDHIHFTDCHGLNNGSPVAGIGYSFALAGSWFCSISDCSAEGDVTGSLSIDRDSQYNAVTGNSFDIIELSGNPLNANPAVATHVTRPLAYPGDGTYYGAYNNVISGNAIRATRGLPGIAVAYGDDNIIEGNVIRHCQRDGIRVLGGHRNIIRGNKVMQWGLAVVLGQANAIRVAGVTTPSTIVSDGNVIDGNDIGDGDAGIVVSLNGAGASNTSVLRNRMGTVTTPFYFAAAGYVSEFEHFGAGTPEGAIVAPVGSRWWRSDGGAGTSMYVKETGTGNTGWVGK